MSTFITYFSPICQSDLNASFKSKETTSRPFSGGFHMAPRSGWRLVFCTPAQSTGGGIG